MKKDTNLDPNRFPSLAERMQEIKTATFPDGSRKFITEKVETSHLRLIPDPYMPPAIFRPVTSTDPQVKNPLIPTYYAHPVTIRAIRKDILLAGSDLELGEYNYRCSSCQNLLDLQFWEFCPYCEKRFS